jgi:hypothetical protein
MYSQHHTGGKILRPTAKVISSSAVVIDTYGIPNSRGDPVQQHPEYSIAITGNKPHVVFPIYTSTSTKSMSHTSIVHFHTESRKSSAISSAIHEPPRATARSVMHYKSRINPKHYQFPRARSPLPVHQKSCHKATHACVRKDHTQVLKDEQESSTTHFTFSAPSTAPHSLYPPHT